MAGVLIDDQGDARAQIQWIAHRMQTSHLDEETIRTAKKTKLKVKEELEKLRQDATRNTR